MKTLRFFYRMAFHYNQPVKGHYIFLRCFPKNTVRQHIEELDYTIEPLADMAFDNDHFGNRTADCLIAQPHSGIQVMIRGKVRTGLDIYEDLESDSMKACLFRYPSKYTQPGDALKAYHQELALDTIDGDYEKVLCIMRNLSERMRYEKDVTDINTTAEEALTLGCGVCQDHAHIMLALCRMERIPSRYVVGLLQGEGVTHAWVETLCKGYWYGFDPTNNLLVNDDYIKFSHGRDYEDCLVNKGFFTGATAQQQEIEAMVSEQ
jgi:transglutaminase-like putative cysteine protease